LADTDTAADRTDKDHIAPSKGRLGLRLVKVQFLHENGGNEKDKANKHEPDGLRVGEEQALNVSLLYVGLVRDLQESVVTAQYKVNILLAERDHSPVVNDKVVQKCVCLLVRIINCLLIELELRHAETAQNHKG
jgi:hypothetical protein